MASRAEIAVERYQCSQLGSIAEVTLKYATAPGTALREFTQFDCTEKRYCGVITCGGKTGTLDWSKCPHPRAPK